MTGRLNLILAAACTALSLQAQYVVSAKSGVVNYVEGTVKIAGKEIAPKFGEFPEVKKDQTLATEDGRAEVLLNPGIMLRLAEDSSMRMLDTHLEDTHVELLSGSAMLDATQLEKYNSLTIHIQDSTIAILKSGLYRIDMADGRLRVYDGEARVTSPTATVSVRKGKQVRLGAVMLAENFDTKTGDDAFYRWGARRSQTVARANPSAARGANCFATTTNCTGWVYNPYFGTITYIPGSRMYCNYFGECYYSPSTVYAVYYPPAGGGGFGGPGLNAGGLSNAGLASPVRLDSGISDGRVGAASAGPVASGPAATGVSAAPAVSAPAGGGRGR